MDRKPDDEIGALAALLGMTFVCATVWCGVIWVTTKATLLLLRLA